MKAVFSGLCVAAALAVLPVSAQAANISGEEQTCINLRDIAGSPAIDERTILIKMKSGQYKRIDLANTCSGLTFSGFAQTTPEDRLCRTNPLRVLQMGGQTCMIDKIVNIDEAEGRALEASR